jgi:hypothetical protein
MNGQDNDEDVKGVKRKKGKTTKRLALSWVSAGRSAYRWRSSIYAADIPMESIPADPYTLFDLAKGHGRVPSFFADATDLVTGSSDGLIEIGTRHQQLRLDLRTNRRKSCSDTIQPSRPWLSQRRLVAGQWIDGWDGPGMEWIPENVCASVPAHQDSVVSWWPFRPTQATF